MMIIRPFAFASTLALGLVLGLAFAPPVVAQPDTPAAAPAGADDPATAAPAGDPAPADAPAAAAAPAAEPAQPAHVGTYRSPMREQCTAELRKDEMWRRELRQQLTGRLLGDEAGLDQENLKWRALMKQELAHEIHDEDARSMIRNKRHVFLAYGALWVLTACFVAFMFLKQRQLKDEIARLERDIRDASRQ